MRARLRSLLVLGALVLVLTSCSVDATLTVHVNANGSGAVSVRVALDRAAVRAVEVAGGTLEDRIRLGDLQAAGWRVGRWHRRPAGGATIVVGKSFTDPGQVAAIVRELNGTAGPFRGFTAARHAATFSTRWSGTGVVDLRSIDPGVQQDPELVAALTADRVDPKVLQERIAASALTGLTIRARVELPGSGAREVRVAPGRRAMVVSAADETAWGRVALLAGGAVAVVLAAVVLVLGEARARRRRGMQPTRIPRREA